MLSCIDLFSGIGGMARAARDAGFDIRLLCEIEPYCRTVLEKHFPGVRVVEDVHDVSHEKLKEKFPRIGSVTLLTGGFPFQANYSRGENRRNDPRSLWDQFVRVAREAGPTWVVAETVPRLLHLGLDDAAWDLEREGYAVTSIVFPAQAIDCPLRKDRLYLVGARREDSRPHRESSEPDGERPRWAVPEPGVCRVAERFPEGLDTHLVRLCTLGDATVPQSAFQILRHIADVEREWLTTRESLTATI